MVESGRDIFVWDRALAISRKKNIVEETGL